MSQTHKQNRDHKVVDDVVDEDLEWERVFSRIEELRPLFTKLPTTYEHAGLVFEKFLDPSHVGPIVLVRNVTDEAFEQWLASSQLGLHKSAILPSGTVYCAQACVEDHGRIRSVFGDAEMYPCISRNRAHLGILKYGSGARDKMNPDGFWEKRIDPNKGTKSVVFEVGTTQSLPSLRQRAYGFFATNAHYISLDVRYFVLVRRYYAAQHIYVEVWRRDGDQAVLPEPDLVGKQIAPADLNVPPSMIFVGNAHAQIRGYALPDNLKWMRNLGTSVSIAEASIVTGGSADVQVVFDAQLMLEECELMIRNTKAQLLNEFPNSKIISKS